MVYYHTPSSSDFYYLLQIPRNAPPNDIKAAYHRTLLRLHPDKQPRPPVPPGVATPTDPTQNRAALSPPPTVDIALLKEAYRTLSDAVLRASYDTSLRQKGDERALSGGPRPAQVVSLEEFTVVETVRHLGSGSGMITVTDPTQGWQYRCRCGGMYCITQDDLENEMHLVGCESCSEVVWVGYEEEVISEDVYEGER